MDSIRQAQELEALEAIWRGQAPATGMLVDYSDPALSIALRPALIPDDHAGLEGLFKRIWDWPGWVRVYAKPPQAVLAASRLARARGLAPGITWVAPGTGAPLDPSQGQPGLAILRCDWAPGADSAAAAAEDIKRQGLLLVVDETTTGLRLEGGGACQAFGLEPDMVLWAPCLPAGRTLGLLAGKGDPPPEFGDPPEEHALHAAVALLSWAVDIALPPRLATLGRNLAVGLKYFGDKAGLTDEVAIEGPPQLPRLSGRRLWAFMGLCKEERLLLAPLLMLDPSLGSGDAQELVWPRLARACARLKVLPSGDMAPLGWRDAGPDTCHAVKDILDNLED